MTVLKMKHIPLKEYAREILKDWTKPSPHALPYLEAMLTLNQIEEYYLLDGATGIVLYFLANAQSWRGETARRIKAELNKIVKNCDLEKSAENGRALYGLKPKESKP